MSISKEVLERQMRNTTQRVENKTSGGIPANPEIVAKLVQNPLATEQSTAEAVASPVDSNVSDSQESIDFFGDLAQSMEDDTQSTSVPSQEFAPDLRDAVVELPYEAPIHQRVTEPVVEAIPPQELSPEDPPVPEEDLRLTMAQWQELNRTQQASPVAPDAQSTPATTQPPVDVEAMRNQALDYLQNNHYALSEEDSNLMISEPERVLPRLAAQMHLNMQTQIAQQIAQALPQLIETQIQQSRQTHSLEETFFTAYPTLSDPKFRDTVKDSLLMVRNAHPQATREEVMRDGAAFAATRLRIQLANAPPQSGSVPPVQQQVPQNPAPTMQPFIPAQTGGGTEPIVPVDNNAGNMFAELAMDKDWPI